MVPSQEFLYQFLTKGYENQTDVIQRQNQKSPRFTLQSCPPTTTPRSSRGATQQEQNKSAQGQHKKEETRGFWEMVFENKPKNPTTITSVAGEVENACDRSRKEERALGRWGTPAAQSRREGGEMNSNIRQNKEPRQE